jgi:hypothetical protein
VSSYEDIVVLMRKQGNVGASKGIRIAVMTGPKSCEIEGLKLDGPDLYIPDRLLSKMCTGVGISSDHEDKSTYSPALKAGDLVAVYKLNDAKYIIIDRVVNGS